MTTHESEFRQLFLVYCLDRLAGGQYVALNRRYKPVGFNSTSWVNYEAHPVSSQLKSAITPLQVRTLSCKGDAAPDRIYLYGDSCVPTESAAAWAAYSARLQLLAGLTVVH